MSKNASKSQVNERDSLSKNVIVKGDKLMYDSFSYSYIT